MDTSCSCQTCGKYFSTANAYTNHLQSKKHREAAARQDKCLTVDVQQLNTKIEGKMKNAAQSNNEMQGDPRVASSFGDMEASGGVSDKDIGN